MIYCVKYCQPTEDWKLAVDLIQPMDCWCSFQRVCSNTEQISGYSAKKWMLKRKSFGFYIKISSNFLFFTFLLYSKHPQLNACSFPNITVHTFNYTMPLTQFIYCVLYELYFLFNSPLEPSQSKRMDWLFSYYITSSISLLVWAWQRYFIYIHWNRELWSLRKWKHDELHVFSLLL